MYIIYGWDVRYDFSFFVGICCPEEITRGEIDECGTLLKAYLKACPNDRS